MQKQYVIGEWLEQKEEAK